MTINKNGFRIAALTGVLIFVTAWRAADQTDKATGLPLHPGLTFRRALDSGSCGRKAQMNIYDTPGTAMLTEYVSWVSLDRLRESHYVHKVWSNRAQELLYSADGFGRRVDDRLDIGRRACSPSRISSCLRR